MGNVLQLRQLDPSASVRRALNELTERSRTERFKGLIFVLETEDGEQVIGATGIFAADLGEATEAARAGFNCILEQAGADGVDVGSKLPRRLRKEPVNEQASHVVACSKRK